MNNNHEIFKHKHILLVPDHTIVRSLGWATIYDKLDEK